MKTRMFELKSEISKHQLFQIIEHFDKSVLVDDFWTCRKLFKFNANSYFDKKRN